jgi:predicted alpha/beta hydrolase family esterase
MKQKRKNQILVIGGGMSFDNNKKFLEFLKTIKLEKILEKQKRHLDWKGLLQKRVGSKFEVYLPSFPNKDNANYTEWKVLLESLLLQLNENSILIGWSLGAIFLAKYFSEIKNNLEKTSKIKAIILVAPPYDDEKDDSLGSFKIKNDLKNLQNIAEKVYIFASKDDPIVNIKEIEKYKKDIPKAHFYILNNYQHFWFPEFPELIKLIKSFK